MLQAKWYLVYKARVSYLRFFPGLSICKVADLFVFFMEQCYINRLDPNEMLIHVQESDISQLHATQVGEHATQQLSGSMCLINVHE